MTLLIAESHGVVIKGFHQGFGFPKNQSKNGASKSKKSLGCHLHVVMLIKVSIPSSQACIHEKRRDSHFKIKLKIKNQKMKKKGNKVKIKDSHPYNQNSRIQEFKIKFNIVE